jgi:hypothetical protein
MKKEQVFLILVLSVSPYSREFADPVAARHLLEFLNVNKTKILESFPSLLPQVQSP